MSSVSRSSGLGLSQSLFALQPFLFLTLDENDLDGVYNRS